VESGQRPEAGSIHAPGTVTDPQSVSRPRYNDGRTYGFDKANPNHPYPQGVVMAPIKAEDFITSIADSLQYISYYHPVDFVRAMTKAYER
jgi:hypothetical protein